MCATWQAVHSDRDLRRYHDSKWFSDALKNVEQHKWRKWSTKGKQPIQDHDLWEDIHAMVTTQ